MPKTIFMVLSLTVITSVCGFALGALNDVTSDTIVEQILINKQLPAARSVLSDAGNDLLIERQTLEVGENRKNWPVIFPGKRSGESDPYGVAFEMISDKGFGGNMGVMIGFDISTGDLLGIAVTTHSETPGVGARAATDAAFLAQFQGASTETEFQVKADGGQVDALTGATVTSRAVCEAVNKAVTIYGEQTDEIQALASEGGAQ